MTAYLFASTDELLASLRLIDDPAAWRQPVRLTRLRDAAGTEGWLLECPTALARLAPVSDAAAVTSGWRPVDRLEAPNLVQAVPLVPADQRPVDGPLYLDCADDGVLVQTAREHLMLGCDRLRQLGLGGGRRLLAVDQPAVFLLRKYETSGRPRILAPCPGDARLLVPWGWAYPLADKLRFQPGGDGERWLVEPGGPWLPARGAWSDVYDLVAVDSRQLHQSTATPAGAVPRVTVELRLEPDDSTPRPTLWRLPGTHRQRLEAFLREAGEAELGALQVAVTTAADGSEAYLIAERQRGGTGGIDLPGSTPFYPRLPDERLFLAAGRRLVPILARGTLVSTLGLAESHLTLIEPGADGGLALSRIPAAAFAPITRLVDYRVAGEPTAMADLMAAVTVEFDRLEEEPATAPEAPVRRERIGLLRRLFGRRG